MTGTAMSMEVRARIVELFEKHRATPDEPYDERHFLDFLLAEPKEKGALHNSFRGLRRYNHFMNEVQYEFGVCFSIKDWSATYSLDRFVERLTKLRQSRRGSLRSLQRRIRDGYDWGIVLVADILVLMLGNVVRSISWAFAAVVIIAVAANVCFAIHAWKGRSYLLRLRARVATSHRSSAH